MSISANTGILGVVEIRPIREGQLSTEDLRQGMKLQPCGKEGLRTPVKVVDVLEGSEWLLAITLFEQPPFPGWTPRRKKRSKADLGLEPYDNGLWNASNYCLALEG